MTKQIGNHRDINIRRAIIGILLITFSSCIAEVAIRTGWLDAFEYTFYDLWHHLSGRRDEPRHAVIVTVDDQAFLEHPDEPLVFWGPILPVS